MCESQTQLKQHPLNGVINLQINKEKNYEEKNIYCRLRRNAR
jgi:hypothetical protein